MQDKNRVQNFYGVNVTQAYAYFQRTQEQSLQIHPWFLIQCPPLSFMSIQKKKKLILQLLTFLFQAS